MATTDNGNIERSKHQPINQQFSARFKEFRENTLRQTQKSLEKILHIDQTIISRWETQDAFPNLVDIDQMINAWGKDQVARLLGLYPPNDYEGIQWIEDIPNHIQGKQRDEIQLGIKLFHLLVVEQLTVGKCTTQLNDTWENLNKYLMHAIQTRCLQLITVPTDDEKQEILSKHYPELRNIIIAKIPRIGKTERYMEGAVIRTEFVTFLAATQALTRSNLGSATVGIGVGMTMLRFAQQSIFSSSTFERTKWIPLTVRNDTEFEQSPFSANSIATLLAFMYPGSKASRLSFVFPERCAQLLEADPADLTQDEHISYTTIHKFDKASTVFMTVGGENHEAISAFESFTIRSREAVNNVLRKLKLYDKVSGDILGNVLNDEGQSIHPEALEVNKRVVFTVDLEKLQKLAAINPVWVIAAMGYKCRATYMAAKKNYANSLVIDSEIADYLIDKRKNNST